MKKMIVFLLALSVLSSITLAQDVKWQRNIDAIGIYNIQSSTGVYYGPGLRYHVLSWQIVNGSLSAGTIKVEKSVDDTTWADLITNQTCTSNGSATIVADQGARLRINLSAFTVLTEAPYLSITYAGYWDNPELPISVASIPLPTGAATETSLAKLPVAQGSTTSGQSGPLIQCAVTTSAPTYTNGQTSPCTQTTAGSTRVNVDNISADIADGSDVTGKAPATIGAQGGTVERAVVDVGDSVRVMSTLTGLPVVWMTALPGDFWEYYANVTDSAEDTVKALETNYYMCITELFVQNASTTVATKFSFKDDTSGATLIAGYADTNGGGYGRGNGSAPVVCNTTVSKGFYSIAGTTGADLLVHVRGFRTKVKPTL